MPNYIGHMLGPKLNTVFRSRWNALFWAAGIMTTAYCSVPDQNGDKGSDTLLQGLASIQHGAQGKPKHVNPWALHQDGEQSAARDAGWKQNEETIENAAKVKDVLEGRGSD